MDLFGNKDADPAKGLAAFHVPGIMPEKAAIKMETRLYVGNLSKSTTEDELNTLFAEAGKVTAVEVIKERKSGESRGFAFVTMSEQSDADKAVRMFNTYLLSEHTLKVDPAKPREQRGTIGAVFEP